MSWIQQPIFLMAMFAVLSSNQRLTNSFPGNVKYLATKKVNISFKNFPVDHRTLDKAAANKRINKKTMINYPIADFKTITKPKDHVQKLERATIDRVKRGATGFKITNLGPNIYREVQARAEQDQKTLWLLNLLNRMDKINEQREQLMRLGTQMPKAYLRQRQVISQIIYHDTFYNLNFLSGRNVPDIYHWWLRPRLFNANWNGTTFHWSNYPPKPTTKNPRPRPRK